MTINFKDRLQLRPLYYTKIDGGTWLPYPIGLKLCKHDLIRARTRHKDIGLTSFQHSNIKIHSIALENPAAGSGAFARWDIVNGWTTTIEEAIKAFPNSPYNKKYKEELTNNRE